MNKNSRPWTVAQVKKMIENGSLVFDNAIQRSFVWDKNRMSLLIDSLLRDYPVPAFYAITGEKKVITPKGEVSVYDCIDGKQRCTTIYRYLNNEFKLTQLEPFMTDDGEVNITGMTYEELPEELQDTLRNAHLQVYSFDDISDEEIAEVMARLNNGKPLSAIDNTRIKAKDLPGIKALAEHKLFMEYLTEKAREGHQAEELVVKTYMMVTDQYESGLDNKYVRPVYESLIITDDIKTQLTQVFDNFYTVIKEIERKNVSVVKKLMKKTHFISFVPTMTGQKNEQTIKNDVGIIVTFFEEGKPSCSDEYNTACIHASNSATNIKIRQDEITKHIKWYLGQEEPVEDIEDETEKSDEELETDLINFLNSESIKGIGSVDYGYLDKEDGVPKYTVEVEGDWKHAHLFLNNELEKWFGLKLQSEEHTKEDGSDWYTSIHTYVRS